MKVLVNAISNKVDRATIVILTSHMHNSLVYIRLNSGGSPNHQNVSHSPYFRSILHTKKTYVQGRGIIFKRT